MKASVILCTYNRSKALVQVLDCLDRQAVFPGTQWELLIVDNNSNDETRAVCEQFAARTKQQVRYILEPRQGKSHALNRGIADASGEILAFTDDDVTMGETWLQELLTVFDRYDCAGVGGKIVPVWTCEQPEWLTFEGPYRLMAAVVRYDCGPETVPAATPPFGANFAFRKRVFSVYGLFRTDIGPNPWDIVRGEDTEFCSRLLAAGETIMYSPAAVVFHPVAESRATKSYYLRWYFDYGRATVRTQTLPAAPTVASIPRYLIRKVVGAAVLYAIQVRSVARFYHRLRLYRFAGEIAEHWHLRRSTRQSAAVAANSIH